MNVQTVDPLFKSNILTLKTPNTGNSNFNFMKAIADSDGASPVTVFTVNGKGDFNSNQGTFTINRGGLTVQSGGL